MRLTIEQQKILEKAQALEKRATGVIASTVLLSLIFFGWLILSGHWTNKFLLVTFCIVMINACGWVIAWLYNLSKELRNVLSQLINEDPQALAQQYEKTLGLGDSEALSP